MYTNKESDYCNFVHCAHVNHAVQNISAKSILQA